MNEFFSDDPSESLPPDMALDGEQHADDTIYTSGIIHYEGITNLDNASPPMADSGLFPEADDISIIEAAEVDIIQEARAKLFDSHADFVDQRQDGEHILKLQITDIYHKANIEVSSDRGLIIDVRYAGQDPENIAANYPADLLEYATPRTISYSDLHKEELQKGNDPENIDINESRWAARQFALHVARHWEREGNNPAPITETPHIQRHTTPQHSSLTITTGLEQDNAAVPDSSKPYADILFERDVTKDDLQNYVTYARRAMPGAIFVKRYYRMQYNIDPVFGMLQCTIEQGFNDQDHNNHTTHLKTRYITGNDESDFRSFLYDQRLQ